MDLKQAVALIVGYKAGGKPPRADDLAEASRIVTTDPQGPTMLQDAERESGIGRLKGDELALVQTRARRLPSTEERRDLVRLLNDVVHVQARWGEYTATLHDLNAVKEETAVGTPDCDALLEQLRAEGVSDGILDKVWNDTDLLALVHAPDPSEICSVCGLTIDDARWPDGKLHFVDPATGK